MILPRTEKRSNPDVSALKEVVRCWGRDAVQHYQLASKGEKYCNQLRAAARQVHPFEEAVVGLDWSMHDRLMRPGRRLLRDSVDPIKQGDLENLRTWSRQDPVPYQKLALADLPDGLAFDKFGLIVHKKHAASLPEPDSTGTSELPASDNANNINTAAPSASARNGGTGSPKPSTLPEAENADVAPQRAGTNVTDGSVSLETSSANPDDILVNEVIEGFMASITEEQGDELTLLDQPGQHPQLGSSQRELHDDNSDSSGLSDPPSEMDLDRETDGSTDPVRRAARLRVWLRFCQQTSVLPRPWARIARSSERLQ
jgi:hypothetical protein